TRTTSPCGAFDMGGDVYQWNDTLVSGQFRGLRGGSFVDINPMNEQSSFRGVSTVPGGVAIDGFRVASIASVPEPATLVLLASCRLGLLGIGRIKRRRSARR